MRICDNGKDVDEGGDVNECFKALYYILVIYLNPSVTYAAIAIMTCMGIIVIRCHKVSLQNKLVGWLLSAQTHPVLSVVL